MSRVETIWPMIAAASLTLGSVHLIAWLQNRAKWEGLFFALMTGATAWLAFCELAMMMAKTPADFGRALRWLHLPTWLSFVAVGGLVLLHLRAGRAWLALLAIGIRLVSLVINFSMTPNINFREITGLRQVTFLGEMVSLPMGEPSPWMALPQLSLVVLFLFVVDATRTAWNRGDKVRALLVGGNISCFIALSTLVAILSFWQLADVPLCGSLFFSGMIGLLASDLSLEAKRSAILQAELKSTQESKHREVAHLGRLATFGEISVSLAHELNQPLGTILINAQAARKILSRESPDIQEVIAILDDIVSENLRASESIKRLRSLLRRGEVKHQILDSNEVIREVIQLLRGELSRREVHFTLDLADALPAVSSDRVQLQQVLLNLLINACDAMADNAPDARHLHIVSACAGACVSIEVIDKGRGLPVESEAIFEAFYTTKPEGLGMGLAICRSIIHAFQGQLWAETNLHGGATFHIALPAMEGES